MTKQVTPRQRAERARRKAMGIALIQKPLRFIANRDSHLVSNKDGTTSRVFGPMYGLAKVLANIGDGAGVQRRAREFL